jgi:hypothetical protein
LRDFGDQELKILKWGGELKRDVTEMMGLMNLRHKSSGKDLEEQRDRAHGARKETPNATEQR